jgi:cytochrome c
MAKLCRSMKWRCGALAAALSPMLALADGDPALGRQQFAPCGSCHNIGVGEPNKVGPNLFGVYGKPAAANRPDFAYSEALRKSGLIWNAEALDAWIAKPMSKVPGTNMAFLGVSNAEVRANIIAFLETAKN